MSSKPVNFSTHKMLTLLESGLSRQAVAKHLGVSRYSIYLRFHAMSVNPKYRDRIQRIAEKHLKLGWIRSGFQEPKKLTRGRPLRAREAITPDRVDRRLWCVNYDHCLDYAASRRWKGFTCRGCEDVHEERPTVVDFIYQDAERCALLLHALSGV